MGLRGVKGVKGGMREAKCMFLSSLVCVGLAGRELSNICWLWESIKKIIFLAEISAIKGKGGGYHCFGMIFFFLYFKDITFLTNIWRFQKHRYNVHIIIFLLIFR